MQRFPTSESAQLSLVALSWSGLPPCVLTGAESDVVSPNTLGRVSKGLRCRYSPASPKSSAASRTSLPWQEVLGLQRPQNLSVPTNFESVYNLLCKTHMKHVHRLDPSLPPCKMTHA